MGSCLMVGAVAMTLSGSGFSLEWSHSIEHSGWREWYSITPAGLTLTRAAVQGSGAGMEPGPDAVLRDGWWEWVPKLPPQPSITLAASGATGAGWRLCDGDKCRELGRDPAQPITLRPCP
ncbi:DUF1850 domain-containing protein [Paracoccus pacificus]|uniref:DUF1850 domain-containing protein n=1 Tax=Paracoccus pacificus TaxID=1463598 RepID=A0ABW4R628_9RHOB